MARKRGNLFGKKLRQKTQGKVLSKAKRKKFYQKSKAKSRKSKVKGPGILKKSLIIRPEEKTTKEREQALDFASKIYKRFGGEVIKSVVLFGSQVKGTASHKSDIDVIVIIDDATIDWTTEMVAWYREELAKIVASQSYGKKLHVNTVRLTTWWEEMLRGEPVVMNIIRYGEPLIDFGGFFLPLKMLLQKGKIKPTPEAIFVALRRSPAHLARSKSSMLSVIEGLYWACVDSSHAALMAAGRTPPSPEHIAFLLYETFVKKGKLKSHYVDLYREMYTLMHRILHGEVKALKGTTIDIYTDRVDAFVGEMAKLVRELEK